MKKLLLFIFIFISISSFAQNTEYKYYYENGNIREILSFNEDKKLDGICLAYSLEGVQTGIASYKNGIKEGEWKIWRPDGSIVYEMFYKNGKKIGTWKMYDEKGNIIKEEIF